MSQPRTLDLEAADLNALLVIASSGHDPDLAPFVGSARLGESFLVAPAHGSLGLAYFTPMERQEAAATGLDLLTPESLEISKLAQENRSGIEILSHALRRALAQKQVEPGRLGLAGSGRSGNAYEALRALEGDGWKIVSGHEVVRKLRKQKTCGEIADIEAAADATVEAFRWLAATLAGSEEHRGQLWSGGAPLEVGRLKAGIAEVLGRRGFGQPEGGIVAPGEEGAVPHNSGTAERVLKSGESLVVDLFPKGRMFADCTRTFCVGEPSPALRKAHAAALEALAWSHRATRPGANGWQLQAGVCDRLSAAGYNTPITSPGSERGYVHGLGHGVGFDLHELPSFRKRDREAAVGQIEVGDVLTLEPGLYDPEAGYGVRLEDLVVVEESATRNLTPLPYALNPREWS